MRPSVDAFVLAGGGSRRFGSDKARAPVGESTMLELAAATLGERYGRVRVVSAPGRTYEDLGIEAVFDHEPDLGPLSGIHAALCATETDHIAIIPCDVLNVQSSWYAALEEACGQTAAAFRDIRWHPLISVVHVDALPAIEQRLAARELAVRDLFDEIGHAVDPPPAFDRIVSVNCPQELP